VVVEADLDWDDAHLINAAYDIHRDDPAFGYRFVAGELRERGPTAGRTGLPGVLSVADLVRLREEAGPEPQGRAAGARGPGRPPVHRARTQRPVADPPQPGLLPGCCQVWRCPFHGGSLQQAAGSPQPRAVWPSCRSQALCRRPRQGQIGAGAEELGA
jgi:hypothetical protein